jgi:hypothetical protein
MRLASLLPFAALAATAAAQHVVTYDPAPAGTGLLFETQILSPIAPGVLPPDPGYLIATPLPMVAPAAAPSGDATYDGLRNRIWYTNGQILASQGSPNFSFGGAALPPFPIAPGVLAITAGPITGMALDPVANILYVASGAGIVVGITPVPGTPVVVPPFPLPFLPAALSGMDYDSVTNTLFVCDVNGLVFNITLAGVPLAPPIGPMAMPGIAGDVCVDKTTQLNAAGLRPIYVCAGPAMRDVSTPIAPVRPNGGIAPTGLAFLGRAATQPGPSGTCGGITPTYMTTAPMTTDNPGFGLRVKNLPPATFVIFAVDWAFNPAGLPVFGGSLLHLIPGSPGLLTFGAISTATGEADLPISLVGVPPGTGPLFTQAVWQCAAHPTGFAITELQSIQVAGH